LYTDVQALRGLGQGARAADKNAAASPAEVDGQNRGIADAVSKDKIAASG